VSGKRNYLDLSVFLLFSNLKQFVDHWVIRSSQTLPEKVFCLVLEREPRVHLPKQINICIALIVDLCLVKDMQTSAALLFCWS